MSTIDNIDQIIAVRDIVKNILSKKSMDIAVYDVVHPNKHLPDTFILVKSINQYNSGNPIIKGTVEVCLYVKNLSTGEHSDDHTQPNLYVLDNLTKAIVPELYEASKNRIDLTDLRTRLVSDSDTGYFYQSVVINTNSINV